MSLPLPPPSATLSLHSSSDASEADTVHSWSTAATASSSSYRLHECVAMHDAYVRQDKDEHLYVTTNESSIASHEHSDQRQGPSRVGLPSTASSIGPKGAAGQTKTVPKRKSHTSASSKTQLLHGSVTTMKAPKRQRKGVEATQLPSAKSDKQKKDLPPASMFSFLPPSSLLPGIDTTALKLPDPVVVDGTASNCQTTSNAFGQRKASGQRSSKEVQPRQGAKLPRSISFSNLDTASWASQDETLYGRDDDSVAASTTDKQATSPTQAHIARPPNSFICFRRQFVQTTKAQEALSTEKRQSQANVSRAASLAWKALSEADKQQYVDEADEKARQHRLQYPNYKFSPARRKSAPETSDASAPVLESTSQAPYIDTPTSSRAASSGAASPTSLRSASNTDPAKSRLSGTQRQRAGSRRQRPQTLDLTLPVLSHETTPSSSEWMNGAFDNTLGFLSSSSYAALPNSSSPETILTLSASPQPATPSTSDAVMTCFARLFALSSPQAAHHARTDVQTKPAAMGGSSTIESGQQPETNIEHSDMTAPQQTEANLNGEMQSSLTGPSAHASTSMSQMPPSSATYTNASVFSGFNDPWLLDVLANDNLLDTSFVSDDQCPASEMMAPTTAAETRQSNDAITSQRSSRDAEATMGAAAADSAKVPSLPPSLAPVTYESCCIDDYIVWPMTEDGAFTFGDA